jgi:hypothetical protein
MRRKLNCTGRTGSLVVQSLAVVLCSLLVTRCVEQRLGYDQVGFGIARVRMPVVVDGPSQRTLQAQ